MKRPAPTHAIVVTFVAVTLLPLVLFLSGVRGEPQEREPVARPDASRLARLDADALAQAQAWFADRFPGREMAVRAHAAASLALGASPNDTVIVGADGWLFLRSSVSQPCLSPDRLVQFERQVADAADVVAATGRRLHVLLAPDKAAVYPQHLPAHWQEATCAGPNWEAVRAIAARQPHVMIDPTGALLRTSSPSPTYHPTDTHWTTETAARVAEDIAARLLGEAFDATLVEAGRYVRAGDLSDMVAHPTIETAACLAVLRPGVSTDVTAQRRGCLTVPRSTVSATGQSAEARLAGPLVMLHDSFAHRFQLLLPPLTRSYQAMHVDVAPPDSVEGRAAIVSSTEILYSSVMRFADRRIVSGELAGQFAVSLRDELDGADVALSSGPAPANTWRPAADLSGRWLAVTLQAPAASSGPWHLQVHTGAGWQTVDSLSHTAAGTDLVWFDLPATPLPAGADMRVLSGDIPVGVQAVRTIEYP